MVHPNSWGIHQSTSFPYSSNSAEIDDFVWNHQDMVICFAAGNDGADANKNGVIDQGQTGAHAASKNCITVGASESKRPDIGATYGDLKPPRFPVFPITSDPMANRPEGLSAFSSRGPTKEGRFKPDVVAPGTSILSTHSRIAPTQTFFGT